MRSRLPIALAWFASSGLICAGFYLGVYLIVGSGACEVDDNETLRITLALLPFVLSAGVIGSTLVGFATGRTTPALAVFLVAIVIAVFLLAYWFLSAC